MKGKRLIIACIAVIATLLIAAASVLATNAVVESKSVGVDKALAAAIEANELDPAAVEEASVKLRIRDGVAVYVVKLETENVKYFVTVNAQTCEIIESAKNECIRPEKPEKPEKPEEDTSDNITEGDESADTEKPECGKKPQNGKKHNNWFDKWFGKKNNRKPSCDKNPLPEETPAPETTA